MKNPTMDDVRFALRLMKEAIGCVKYSAVEEAVGFEPYMGVCTNLDNIAGVDIEDSIWEGTDAYAAVPNYSGDEAYPLPGGMEAYDSNTDKWCGVHATDRLALIDWLLHNMDNLCLVRTDWPDGKATYTLFWDEA